MTPRSRSGRSFSSRAETTAGVSLYQDCMYSQHTASVSDHRRLHWRSNLSATDSAGDLFALVMLDLSATFDALYHHVLRRRLKAAVDVVERCSAGSKLTWLDRLQHVLVGSSTLPSTPSTVFCGVPHGPKSVTRSCSCCTLLMYCRRR